MQLAATHFAKVETVYNNITLAGLDLTGEKFDDDGNKVHYGKVVDVDYKAPTRDTEGWTEGWHCESCGEVVNAVPIPKLDVDDE